MALIDAERDDEAVLAAEDEAIRLAANPPEEPPLPVGGELARLIESLTDGSTQVSPEGRQG